MYIQYMNAGEGAFCLAGRDGVLRGCQWRGIAKSGRLAIFHNPNPNPLYDTWTWTWSWDYEKKIKNERWSGRSVGGGSGAGWLAGWRWDLSEVL